MVALFNAIQIVYSAKNDYFPELIALYLIIFLSKSLNSKLNVINIQ